MSDLLIDDYPLMVLPHLATKIGLNEAIFLQQVQYWLKNTSKTNDKDIMAKHYHDERWWVYNTFEQWQEQFPFWSIRTIKRIVTNLENMGLLVSDNYNKMGYDRTKWYTIDYDVLESLENTDSDKLAQSKVTDCPDGKCQVDTTNTIDYSENTNKDYVKCKMVRFENQSRTEDFSLEIVEKQIVKICRTLDIEPYIPLQAIEYYLDRYLYYLGKNHPKMRNTHYERVITFINDKVGEFDYTAEDFQCLIDRHFEVEYGQPIDYNMLHFFTEGIFENREFETLYN